MLTALVSIEQQVLSEQNKKTEIVGLSSTYSQGAPGALLKLDVR